MELQGVKSYGKGETIDLDFATFTVERVDIGKTERVHIFSEDELVYNGEVTPLFLSVSQSAGLFPSSSAL